MKNRSLKELYPIVLTELRRLNVESRYNSGLCGLVDDLFYEKIITSSENIKILRHIKKNKPQKGGRFAKFMKSLSWQNGIWWWDKMRSNPQGRADRIAFIEALLKHVQR